MSDPRCCVYCLRPMLEDCRPDAATCSRACRVAAFRARRKGIGGHRQGKPDPRGPGLAGAARTAADLRALAAPPSQARQTSDDTRKPKNERSGRDSV